MCDPLAPMNKILCLLLLATSFALENRAVASTDYGNAWSMEACDGLPTNNVPRFKAYHVKVTVDKRSDDGDYIYYVFEAVSTKQNSVMITNYWESVHEGDDPYSSTNNSDGANFAMDFYYAGCGLYVYSYGNAYSESPDALVLQDLVDGYLTGHPDSSLASMTEHHNGSSFNVNCVVTNANSSTHYEVSRDYDGAVLPTRNMNHGRDNDPCAPGCADCAGHGMPRWHISEPYLNLWVHDTPVFYKTSLGQEVAFKINYKQRDTRPKDDGQYPTTGWNHNWYSYVHFDIPVISDDGSGNTNITGVSARGVRIQAGWTLTNDYSRWEAILYAPDNSESYFSAGKTADPQNQRTLVPIVGSQGIAGFRLVHGDGSQDIYTRTGAAQTSYGIVERYGCVFDKAGVTNGMEGIWRQHIAGSDTPHREWQFGDDAANYTSAVVTGRASSVQQLDYFSEPMLVGEDPTLPAGPNPPSVVEYVSCDALLTARLDPYGNAITLGYEGQRLSTITDYDGRTNYLNYDTNGYLQSVAMPYGRTAYFSHDSAGNLGSITDAQGMTSTMSYVTADGGLNRRLSSLTTPYGTTQFAYQDDTPYVLVQLPSYYAYSSGSAGLVTEEATVRVYVGENNANHAIMVAHPDASQELYFYCGITNGSPVPLGLPMSAGVEQVWGGVVDHGGVGGEGSLLLRNCFHWGRAQTPLLSMTVSADMVLTNLTEHDFRVGTWQHFPVDNSASGSANWSIAPFPTFMREGSPDGLRAGNITWFAYDTGSAAWQLSGEPLNWDKITAAPDGAALATSYTYNSWGQLTEIREPYTETDGSLRTRSYGLGYRTVSVGGDGVMVPQSFSWPGGGWVSLNAPQTANVNGYPVLSWPMIEATDNLGNCSKLFFNARHQLSGVKQANGLTVTNLYGGDGFLQKSIAMDAQATNTYAFQNGELASCTTPLGLTLNFTHDLLGRLTGVGFPDGSTLSNVFDNLDLVAAKDRLGHWSYATYDSLRQLQSLTDRNGGTTLFSYCDCGGLTQVVDPVGNTNTYRRNYLGRVTNLVSAAGSVVIERDTLGQPFHVSCSAWGLDLRLGHNYQGLRTGLRNLAGSALSVVYDEADMPVMVTDGAGVRTTRTFDSLGRLLTRDNGLTVVEDNYYSTQGLSSQYDGRWNETYYGYDSAGRLCAITNRNQEVTQIGYDVPHRRVSLTDGRNHTKWWAFDMYGRQVAETNANSVLVKTNGYDANSNLTAEWTAAKGLTTFNPDNNGNVLAIHYPNATVSYTYDHLDRLLTMSDGLGSHTFSYANFGAFDWELASEAGPLGTISHGYSGPNLASISINNSVWESITRDAALRPGTITSPAGTFTYGFNGAGRLLASLAMPGSTTAFDYDAAGELLSVAVTNSAQTALDYHSYEYNENGWITAAYRLGGVRANYTYDNIGQLLSADAYEPNSTLRLNENLDYSYDASHNLATRTANMLVQAFTSDALNQLSSIVRSGTLTVSGSITGAVATLGVNGKPAQIYSDGTFATTEGLTLRDGNNMFVTTGSNASGALVLSTISSNRLPVTVSFGYDLNGNLTSDGQRALEYDDANQLTAVTVPGLYRTEFVYDGLSRRRIVRDHTWASGSWQAAGETRYVCDGYLPVQERDANGNVLVTYTRGLDLSGTFGGAGGIGGLLARTDSSGSAFYHADVVGNITSLSDSSGSAVARYLQDPFGRALGMSGPLAGPNVMRHSSMPYYDQADVLGYPLRVYDPRSHGWTSEDPIGEAGGMNLRGFVGNNPINNIDPDGLDSMVPGVNGTYNNSVPALTLTGTLGGPVTASYPPLDSLFIIGGMTMGGMAAGGYIEYAPGTLLFIAAATLDELYPIHPPYGTQIGVMPSWLGGPKVRCPNSLVASVKNGVGKGIDIRVTTQKEAEAILRAARPQIPWTETYGPKGKIGAEIHPSDGSGVDLPHIKWRDWTGGKSDGAEGHIYFERPN